jgi:hypothetical protein
MGFLALPLTLPESSQAGGSAEFERLCLLRTGEVKGVMEAVLRFSLIIQRALQNEFTFEAI